VRNIQKEKSEKNESVFVGWAIPPHIDPKVLAAPVAELVVSVSSSNSPGSTRDADTAHKVFKARVRAERIEARPQQDAWVQSLFVGCFEPIHGLISIPERCIDHGNLRGIRMTRVRALLQVAQQRYRFAPFAGYDIGARKISYACRATRGKLDRFLQFCDRFLVHVFLKVRLGELIVRESKIGIHFDRLATLSYGFVISVRTSALSSSTALIAAAFALGNASCAVMRTWLPERSTVPSTTASTFSSRAICGSGLCAPLYTITEVREITLKALICARSVINSSVMPSAK